MEHTPENPYCSDLSCWCHSNDTYHATFTDDQLLAEPNERTYIAALELLNDHTYQAEYLR